MSQENIEIARRLYSNTPIDIVAVFSEPTMLEAIRTQVEPLVHSDLETKAGPGQIPLAAGGMKVSGADRQTWVGIDGFLAAWREWLTAWESWIAKPTNFVEVDDERVLVPLDVSARSKTHQVDIKFETANLLTFRDGKLARIELFADLGTARQVAGL